MSTASDGRCALYLRQSLDRAEGIEAQRTRCRSLASAKGWAIVEEFVDNEVRASAARGEGTKWHAMLQRIGVDFDIVVAVDLDRLVRSTKDLNTLVDLGAKVVTVDGEIDLTSADGKFRATMIAAIANFETQRASERQRRHKSGKAERGEWHGGTVPYGYQRDGKSLAPMNSEVALIGEAATRLLDDRETMHSIIVDWNSPTVPGGTTPRHTTRTGKHWRQSNLRAILLNRTLLGETKAGVVGWEPIIDERTFERLGTLLGDPSRKVTHSPGVKGGKYAMGGGLTVCGLCEKPLITNTKRTPGGVARPVLSCLRRVHGADRVNHPAVQRRRPDGSSVWQDTGRVSIDHDQLERFVFESLIQSLRDRDRFHKRLSEQDPETEAKVQKLEAMRNKLHVKRDRDIDLYEDGIIKTKNALKVRIDKLDAEIEAITRAIDARLSQPAISRAIEESKGIDWETWKTWTPSRRRAFLRMFIDRVLVKERVKRDADYKRKRGQRESPMAAIGRRTEIRWRWDS